VLTFVLTIAVLNFTLGVGVAVALSHEWSELSRGLPNVRSLLSRKQPHEEKPAEEQSSGSQARKGDEPAKAPPAAASAVKADPLGIDLPEGWPERLAKHEIRPTSFFEAVLHLVRVEDEENRGRWVAAERALRVAARQISTASIVPSLNPIRSEASTWLGWAREILEELKNRHDSLGERQRWAEELEELLVDQCQKMESLRDLHDASVAESDIEMATRKFVRELSTIFEKSYALRDFALDRLAQILVAENRLAETPPAWQRDAVTGYPNRIGLENVIAKWLADDPSRKRLLSGAYIEIDRLGKLNERLDAQQADQVVKAFAKLVEGAIRADRGDCVIRIAGPTIFLLAPDTGIAGAKTVAERIRQTVEASTFEARSEEFTLAANCAVCEFMFDDTLAVFLARLQAGLNEAKRGGRNRTAVDEGQGPVLFDAQPIQVKAQTIRVDEGK